MSIRHLSPSPMGATPAPAPSPTPTADAPTLTEKWAKETGQTGQVETPQGTDPRTRFGPLEKPEWVPIEVNGITVQVTRTPLHSLYAGQKVYPPFSLLDAIDYAEANGLSLPTGKVWDAAQAQGWHHAYQAGFYDVGKTTAPGGMNAPDTIVEMGRKWGIILRDAPSDKPVPNIGKVWLLDAIGVSKPGFAVNHGWYDKAGTPVQNKGRRHGARYKDASQMGSFVKRETGAGDYNVLAARGAFGDAPVDWSAFVKAARAEPSTALAGGLGTSLAAIWQAIGAFFTSPRRAFSEGRFTARAWKGNEHWTDADIARLVEIGDAVKVNPADILLVHLSETGGDPFAKNPLGAVGLIQWTDGTAKMLGTRSSAIAEMTLPEQLDLLEKHAQRFWKGRGIRNAADLYLLNATGGKVCKTGETCYEGNRVWDLDKDGDLDKVDLANQLNKVWRQRYGAELPLRTVY